MGDISIFSNPIFGELRTVVDPDGNVWFVASDVAKSLGYLNSKSAVKRHVDMDDVFVIEFPDNTWGVKRTLLKNKYIDSIKVINESGLYSLVLSSKIESAKKFKRWVTYEVLPSIRKTGSYSISSQFALPKDYPSALRALADEVDAKNKAIAERNQIEIEKQ